MIKMSASIIQMAACWYPVTVFGSGNKLGVWFQGCSRQCKECISPEYQPYGNGTAILVDELFSLLGGIVPDGLVVSGGEPFDQPDALFELVSIFNEKYNNDVLIYTGYTMEEMRGKPDPIYKKIIDMTAVLIDGTYIAALNSGSGLAGSSNQKIHIRKLHAKYKNAEKWERKMMCILREDQSIWMIGVPPLEA